jgi:hypothetical protein
MIRVEMLNRMPAPRVLVLAFMAGMSHAAGLSYRLYVDELATTVTICGSQEIA